MRNYLWRLLLFGFATTSLAQRVVTDRAAATGVVTGHVYCADTNGPARLATVILEPVDTINGYRPEMRKTIPAHMTGVQTLPDGSFSIPHVAPGAYYVFASKPGYLSPLASIGVSDEELQKPDEALKETIAKSVPRITIQPNVSASVDIILERGAAISGNVHFDDGSPASGLAVRILVHKNEKWVPLQSSPTRASAPILTDDLGAYRISGLPAHEYLLEVDFRLTKTAYDFNSDGSSTSTDVEYSIPIYSGNSTRPKEATPFSIKLGEERPGEDIQVPLSKLHIVSGSIVAARDGHMVNGANVTLLYADDRSEETNTHLRKDDNGFTLNFVPEGDYILRITNASDIDYEEVPNPPGVSPATMTEPQILHVYGPTDLPLHVGEDISSLAVAVPERSTKKAQTNP
jgi:hypothetical protein